MRESKEVMLSNIFILSWSLKEPIIVREVRKSADNLLKKPL